MADVYETPPEVAEYFAGGRKKAQTVTANDDFTLTIKFDNGETRVFDMEKTLKGRVFAPFRNIERFREVYIDGKGSIAWDIDKNVNSDVHWFNHVDICPDNCYIYSKHA